MKTYESIEELFKDEIITPTEIIIFCGKRGKGKTSLGGWFMSEFMKPRQARPLVRQANIICDKLYDAGFNLHPPQDHTVFCNTSFIKNTRNGGAAYIFDPLEFCLPNDVHTKTLVFCPCGHYFIDEAQDIYDSNLAAPPTFVTKNYELSRQLKLFIALFSQRGMRINKSIREISIFIICKDIEVEHNKYGRISSVKWECALIYENSDFECYMQSKKKERVADLEFYIKANFNIFNCYDTNYFMPLFFRGMQNRDIELVKSKPLSFDPWSFDEFYNNHTIDIPDSFRGKVKNKQEKKS